MKKYVLTGGPCTGKTTTIKILTKYGYQTVREAASILVSQEFNKTTKPLWEIDIIAFQRQLILKQLEFEREKINKNFIFIDRGIIDTIAYCKIYNASPPKDFYKIAEENRYDKVFILDFLKSYKNSNIRKESRSKALEIQSIILETYKEFGYNPISIPNLETERRTNLILEQINYIPKHKLHKKFQNIKN